MLFHNTRNSYADAILERVTQNVYKAVDHQQEAHNQKVTDLQKKVTSLEGDLARVKGDLDDHEQYSRRNSLRLYGIKEEKDKNRDTVVVELIKSKLDVDVTEKDLDRSHRVTPKNPSNGPRLIIVKFSRHNVRQKVYAVRTKLKGSQIFIREDGSDCEKAKAHARNFEARIHRQSLVNRRTDPSPDKGKQGSKHNKTH